MTEGQGGNSDEKEATVFDSNFDKFFISHFLGAIVPLLCPSALKALVSNPFCWELGRPCCPLQA